MAGSALSRKNRKRNRVRPSNLQLVNRISEALGFDRATLRRESARRNAEWYQTLKDRRLLATFIVSSIADVYQWMLRQTNSPNEIELIPINAEPPRLVDYKTHRFEISNEIQFRDSAFERSVDGLEAVDFFDWFQLD